MGNGLDVVAGQAGNDGLHERCLNGLAGPDRECLELAFDVHRVLPCKPGPNWTSFSQGAMAGHTGGNAIICNTLQGYGLSLAKQSVFLCQRSEFIG